MRNILIIGSGAFGTSIASIAAENFKQVLIKVRSQESFNEIQSGENHSYLPGIALDQKIKPVLAWDQVREMTGDHLDLIVFGLPTKAISSYLSENKEILEFWLNKNVPIVCLSKGIDADTLQLPDELFESFFPTYQDLLTFLSGPSFAKEILEKQVTLVSLAGSSRQTLMKICQMLQTSYFKMLPTYDVKGVLLGGALKNILAIGGGILEGLGFNHNTRAAMITRGIEEMLRIGAVYHAKPETFYGLSGMGDLILTTTGELSRNKQFGVEIAKGRKPLEIINSQRSVVEGYRTTKAVHAISLKHELRTPLFHMIYSILYEGLTPKDAIRKLMDLPVKFED